MNHNELLNSVRKGEMSTLKKFAAHPRLLARLEEIAASPISHDQVMRSDWRGGGPMRIRCQFRFQRRLLRQPVRLSQNSENS